MSLRWRIALALAAIAAATTLSVGIVSYRATSTRLLEEVDDSLDQAWRTIEADVNAVLDERGLLDVFIVQAVLPNGQIVATPGRDGIGPGPGPAEVSGLLSNRSYDTVAGNGEDVRFLSVGVQRGTFQVGRSLVENERVLHDLRSRTILLVGIVTLAAAVFGWLVATTVTGPLMRLTRAATDVERSGRLDVAVPVGGKDEVARLGDAFNGMLAALAASRDDQRRLVEDAGHELRTPLTSVRTNLAVLRRHPDLDPETRGQIVDDLHAETEELVGLVEEVVALAKGVTDGAPPEPVALGPLAAAVAARAERRHGRTVTVVADGSVVEVSPPALERAISNLIDNAAKFDESGQPIEVVVADGELTVLDRGPGIAPGDETRVFDRFYRAEDARSLPGSGLGLSIVREVAVGNGGSVVAAPRPGGGAQVGFRLPVVAPDGPGPPAPTPTSPAPPVA
jgi:two-component system sensor histidine kinase MprB